MEASQTTPPASDLEAVARHEAGHVLAYWWNGDPPEAVEMRRHADGRTRLTSRGREISADVRACVIGGAILDKWTLKKAEAFAGMPPELGRRVVAVDLLGALAGPAVEWRNASDPEELAPDLLVLLEGEPTTCSGDLGHVEELLAMLPEDEREEAYITACRRAEVLVCRHWPEVCALAGRLAASERLEDEVLGTAIAETLGMCLWQPQGALEELDPPALNLGDAHLTAWWERSDIDDWRLCAAVDGMPLSTALEVAIMTTEDLSDDAVLSAPGWYCLDHAAGEVHDGPPPAESTLRKFLAGIVADKLDELRRGEPGAGKRQQSVHHEENAQEAEQLAPGDTP